jgi:type IV pilus assembly protein PilW
MPDTANLSKTYAAGSEILLYRAYTYYIRFNPAGEPSLYRYDNIVGSSDEMVEGVENMQIEYGIDVDNDGLGSVDQFKSQVALAEWIAVRSVRVTLTLRSVGESENNVSDNLNAPRYYNGNQNYTDRRLVKIFTETIGLRNNSK